MHVWMQGALNSGLANFFVAWCAGLKGPVFVASFCPLGPLFATILEMALFGNYVHGGR